MLKAILVKALERKEGNFRKRTYPKHTKSFTTQKENQPNVVLLDSQLYLTIIFGLSFPPLIFISTLVI